MDLATSSKIDKATQERINTWLSGNYDEQTKSEIRLMIAENRDDDLVDSFYKQLEFGTGGLRGVMGVGSNKMNKYTIGAATQGLANYLKKNFVEDSIKVAIAFDSRNNSDVFAQITADVFSANGIHVYLFKSLRPTPLLSFTIRHLNCQSGVVVTASHNPKEYNGYKAYWNDGGQMIAPHDTNVINEVMAIKDISHVKFDRNNSLITILDTEIDNVYIEKVKALSVNPDAIQRQKDMKIVYTPIHGTGITLVPELLKRFGFDNVTVVKEQSEPNGNFPTVVYPNPEEGDALSLAIQKAKEINADLVMATDPDADRVGIAVKDNKGEWILLNGNQTASLLLYYLINAWKDAGKINGKQFICKTIVTSYILDAIAEDNGVKCYNVLTGFKFIADLIKELEGKETFIAGGEESYGYLVGDFVRDKDAVSSCAFIAEMSAFYKDKGQSLYDTLLEIYTKHGLYRERLISITKKGKSGAEEIKEMMHNLRSKPASHLGGSSLVSLMDYDNQEATDIATGNKSAIKLPKSDVLQFITEDGSQISARPSGTEPKIKFYFSVKEPLSSKNDYEGVLKKCDAKIDQIIKDLNL
ncbi:MAG: phospho-sugar mutase [Opitutaceae bacterium]|nr:phospho-sugar mutase [Cytophagales bacterium]